ncbi:MAG: hypothetical protein M3N93_09120 [Acidobacteriota bacterium]|nr:hypothetical protein [Acidobacteriota bacterium]
MRTLVVTLILCLCVSLAPLGAAVSSGVHFVHAKTKVKKSKVKHGHKAAKSKHAAY